MKQTCVHKLLFKRPWEVKSLRILSCQSSRYWCHMWACALNGHKRLSLAQLTQGTQICTFETAHSVQNQSLSSKSPSVNGGSKHSKWKALGQPSQHNKFPPYPQASQKSLLLPPSSLGPPPLCSSSSSVDSGSWLWELLPPHQIGGINTNLFPLPYPSTSCLDVFCKLSSWFLSSAITALAWLHLPKPSLGPPKIVLLMFQPEEPGFGQLLLL